MATKRRKVWANWYPAVGAAPAHWGTRLGTKADACMAAQPCAEQVCLVERLPGDVVLSREDVASIMEAMTSAVVAMDSEGWDSVPEDEGSGATTLNNLREASMLLRGRR